MSETRVHLSEQQEALCRQTRWDFSQLAALFVNCTLKLSPERSHTQGLADISMEIMTRQGVAIDHLRAADHHIPPGVWPDMTEHGWERNEWPQLFQRVMAADILCCAHRFGWGRSPRCARESSSASTATPRC